MSNSVLFSRIMDEYGTIEKEEEAAKDPAKAKTKTERGKGDDLEEKEKKDKAALMQEEERNLGAVSWETYAKYLKFGGTLSWGPFIFGLLMMVQGAAGKHPCACNENGRIWIMAEMQSATTYSLASGRTRASTDSAKGNIWPCTLGR
jgi:hypothetical protein